MRLSLLKICLAFDSLVVASCVTPTDPILAQAVVGGPWAEKHVPAHLRHMLMCESGCNDGAAFPFLYLALFLTTNRDNHGKAIAEWFYDALAYQIIFGTILGALIGWAARKLMRFSERHRLVDRESFVAQYVSLAIASMGVNVLLGSDDLLAAFACGSAFAWDGWFTRQTEDSNFSSIVDLLFNVATFIYIGALMPFQAFAGGPSEEPNTLSIWRLFVLAFCVLLTKRLPIVIALWRWIPDIKTFREAVFAGHFGPIGVGAIFIATLARTRLPQEVNSPPENTNDILALTVQPVIFFFVLCSIILHGLTIPFFALSRRATTITRTWSRNPSFMAGDSEPGWTSKFRRNKTGESMSGGEGNMTEIERVLNAQLTKIGKGAIGGDAEKELRRGDSNTSEEDQGSSNTARGDDSDRSGIHLNTAKGEKYARFANDDYEEEHSMEKEDPMGDWGGDDCIEVKRYRQRIMEEKEREYAQVRSKQQDSDEKQRRSLDEKQDDSQYADLGMMGGHKRGEEEEEEDAPMDRDLHRGKIDRSEEDKEVQEEQDRSHRHDEKRKDKEEREHAEMLAKKEKDDGYPSSKTWVEGHKLIIEHQASRCSDVEVTVIPLIGDERETIGKADEPAHAWVQGHASKIEHYLGLTDVHTWTATEAANHLMHHRIPHKYNDYLSRRLKRDDSYSDEKKEDRDQRSQVLLQSLNWAAEHRHDEDDVEEERKRHIRIVQQSRPQRQSSSGLMSIASAQSGHSSESSQTRRKKVKRAPSPEEEAPVKGWLASPPPGAIKPSRPKKPSRGNSTSISPTRGSNSTNTLKQYISRPSVSDSRRVLLRDKVCSGQLSLGKCRSKEGSFTDELDQDVIHTPADRTIKSARFYGSSRRPASLASNSSAGSRFMPHSASASGMGVSSSSLTSIATPRAISASTNFLQIPRTNTFESMQSSKSSSSDERHKHRKSSSVQWVDEAPAQNITEEAPTSISRPRSPEHRFDNVDLARIGGGVTPRTRSRNPSPTRQGESTERSSTPIATQDDASIREGGDSEPAHSFQHGHRKRSRFANILSSIAAPSHGHSASPSNNRLSRLLDSGSNQDATTRTDGANDTPSRSSSFRGTSGSIEGDILAPPSRTGSMHPLSNDISGQDISGNGDQASSRSSNLPLANSPAVTFDL